MSNEKNNAFNLNEVTFLHRLHQNPAVVDEEMMVFLKEHPSKLETVKQAKEFDKQLVDVMSLIPPEGLADRIIVKNCFSNQMVNNPNWFSGFAMLASLFLVVSISWWAWQSNIAQVSSRDKLSIVASLDNNMSSSIVAHIIEHVAQHPEIMTTKPLAVNDVELQKIFNFVGASLSKPIETMSYAGACVVDGKQGLHVVIQEKTGPVTVIVLPGKHLEVMQPFNEDGFIGNLIPVKGAVVAIVGKSEIQVVMAQASFFKAVKFG